VSPIKGYLGLKLYVGCQIYFKNPNITPEEKSSNVSLISVMIFQDAVGDPKIVYDIQ
jgi:hypothetical protein